MPTHASPGPRSLGLGTYLGYGIGSMGTAVFGTVPGLLLLYFMTETLGVAPALAGLAASLPKLWDMVFDPLMGTLSDRTRSSLGRRRPYLLAGGIALPLCFVLLFSVPVFESQAATFAYVLALYALASTSFSVFQVPYVSMPAEMTSHPHEVTVMISWRMTFLAVGTLLAGALSPMLVRVGGGGRGGYTLMALVQGSICLTAFLGAFFGTRRAPRLGPSETAGALSDHLRAAVRNRGFFVLALSLVVQLVGIGSLVACVPYFAHYVLRGDGDTVTILFVGMFGPAMAGMPLWTLVSKRIGKLRSYMASVALFGLIDSSLFFASPGQRWIVFVQMALLGLAYGGTQVFPFAMLPDTLQAEVAETGIRREGIFSGLFTASEKGGTAVGTLVAGMVLSTTGFVESARGQQVVQPESAVLGIRLATSVIPGVMMLLCLLVLRHYRSPVLHEARATAVSPS